MDQRDGLHSDAVKKRSTARSWSVTNTGMLWKEARAIRAILAVFGPCYPISGVIIIIGEDRSGEKPSSWFEEGTVELIV